MPFSCHSYLIALSVLVVTIGSLSPACGMLGSPVCPRLAMMFSTQPASCLASPLLIPSVGPASSWKRNHPSSPRILCINPVLTYTAWARCKSMFLVGVLGSKDSQEAWSTLRVGKGQSSPSRPHMALGRGEGRCQWTALLLMCYLDSGSVHKLSFHIMLTCE